MNLIVTSINMNPPVRCYQMYAYPLSIILNNNNSDSLNWFLYNFINIKAVYLQSEEHTFVDYRYIKPRYELLDQFYCYETSQTLFEKMYFKDLHEFILQALGNQEVISFYVDEFYITDRKRYGKEHKRHLIMVYGYDFWDNSYLVVGYNQNGKYAGTKVKRDILQEAFSRYKVLSELEDKVSVMGIRPEEQKHKLNYSILVQEMENYLNCKTVYCPEAAQYYFTNRIVAGLDFYRVVQENLTTVSDEFVNYPMFYMIYEHKVNMLLRVQVLQERLRLRKDYLGEIKYLVQLAAKLQRNFHKFLCYTEKAAKSEIVERMIPMLDEIIAIERKTLAPMVEEIKYNMKI